MFTRLSYAVVVWAALGLAAPTLAKTQPDEGNHTIPILMVMGGFGSCPAIVRNPDDSRMHQRSLHVQAVLQQTFNLDSTPWFSSCFDASNNLVRYQTSHTGEQVFATSRAGARQAALTFLAGFQTVPHQVFVIGHSYGGWLATDTVSRLPAGMKISRLVTIDPISPVHCPPNRFIRAYMASQFTFRPALGCTEAPRDQVESYEETAFIVGHWHHYWQDLYGYLHSGPIAAATDNSWLAMETPFLLEFQAHKDIDTDGRIWDGLLKDILVDLKL